MSQYLLYCFDGMNVVVFFFWSYKTVFASYFVKFAYVSSSYSMLLLNHNLSNEMDTVITAKYQLNSYFIKLLIYITNQKNIGAKNNLT